MDWYKNPIRRIPGVTGVTRVTGFDRTLVDYHIYVLKVRKNMFHMFFMLQEG